MKIAMLIYMLLVLSLAGNTQIWEDFSDGDFHSDYVWSGTDSDFVVNMQKQLQLYKNTAGISYLSTYVTYASVDTFVWEFWYKLDFDPSSNNQFRFYLNANQPDLSSTSLKACYIQIGENGQQDAIRLYQQNGLSHTLIGSGTAGSIASSVHPKRIRVVRTASGLIFISLAHTGASFFQYEFQAVLTDSLYPYLGIWVKNTQSQSQHFYFDDIIVSPFSPDTTAPRLIHARASGNKKVSLQFNEALSWVEAHSLQNYIYAGNYFPIQIDLNPDRDMVELTYPDNWLDHENISIHLKNIADTAGNYMADTSLQLTYYQPQAYDLIISEFLADPTPTIGLPNTEFVEIYNRMNYPIECSAYKLCVNQNCIKLPAYSIAPKSYGLIIPENYINYFPGLPILPVSTLPTITNGGAVIEIRDTGNFSIHKIEFSTTWYKDPMKDDGGFTLEKINPDELCGTEDQYLASKSYTGGTPGYVNSVHDSSLIPFRFRYILIDAQKILFIFNKRFTSSDWNVQDFKSQNQPIFQSLHFLSDDSILAEWIYPLAQNQSLHLSVEFNGLDCASMPLQLDTQLYIQNYEAKYGDLIISEIMANPSGNTNYPFEFIEIYNASSLTLELDQFALHINSSSYALPQYHISPGEFVVICGQLNPIPPFLYCKLPSLSNENGIYNLIHLNGQIIHHAQYRNSYFEDALKKNGGYSLELTDLNAICQQKNNWSASTDPKGASPAEANSHSTQLEPVASPKAIYRGIQQDSIILYFDQAINPTYIQEAEIQTSQGKLDGEWISDQGNLKKVYFRSQQGIPWGQTLEISQLKNCETGEISATEIRLPQKSAPSQKGIQINEILFHPESGKSKYVEFLNTGEESVNIETLYLGRYDTLLSMYTSGSKPFPENLWLLPGEIICLSIDPEEVSDSYIGANPSRILYSDKVDLPGSSGGILRIQNSKNEEVDIAAVMPEWHSIFLTEKKGVALERIGLKREGLSRYSWLSAAANMGYGTPGNENSQWGNFSEAEKILELNTPIFSPDMDGYMDWVEIRGKMPESGLRASLFIINESGQIIRSLMQNEICGSELSFIWDGGNSLGQKVPIGIYKIYLKALNATGKSWQDYKAIVVAVKK